jgi:membrane carboxypeptidase/penicillin-binding protein
MEFMRGYIDGRPDKETPPQFQAPGNIVFLPIDRATGSVIEPNTPGAITETFIAGTQPDLLAPQP